MKTALGPDQLAFLAELRAYLDGLDPELVERARAENIEDPMQVREHGRAFLRTLGRDGWIGVGWPRAYGGQGRSPVEQWLFIEELYNRRLPNGLLTVSSIGPTLIRLGTPEQQAEFLPRILAGELDFAIGYSEPDAGSDLASLRTRAVRDGDFYVVNGQKIWTTGAQVATHLWLAVRTGSPESRHRGLSVLITPMDAPGISIRPIITQGGERTNMVFLDNVRVPARYRVGAENDGWTAITTVLNFERMFHHNEPRWELRQLVEWAQNAGLLDGAHPEAVATQLRIGELAADVEVCRLFAFRGARMLARGQVPQAEASANKIWWSELRQRICDVGLSSIGDSGTIAFGSPHAPAHGHLDHGLRSSPVWRFGGGTNEIQLDIIAKRGLEPPTADELDLTENEQLLAETAQSFFGNVDNDHLCELERSGSGYDESAWKQMVDMGWPAIHLPSRVGGGGGTLAEMGVVLREVGAAAYPSPLLQAARAGAVLAAFEPADRTDDMLRRITQGECVVLLAPPSRSLTAQVTDSGVRLSGPAVVAEWAVGCDQIVTLVPTDQPGRWVLLALDPAQPGLALEPVASMDNERVARVVADGLAIPDDQVLVASVPERAALAAIARADLLRASTMVGGASAVLRLTVQYTRQRHQFGRSIASFQAAQHHLARMVIAVDAARLVTDEGLTVDAQGRDVTPHAAVAALVTGRSAVQVVLTAAQLHGGVGTTVEHVLHHHFRRAKAMQLRFGSHAAVALAVTDNLVRRPSGGLW